MRTCAMIMAVTVGFMEWNVKAAANVFMETVPVGNLGNTGEWSGASYGGEGPDAIVGAVDYAYNMGKYEVTAGQYRDFLNAVDPTGANPYALYSSQMDPQPMGCQITWNAGSSTYDFSGRPSGTEADWVNRPVNYVSWGDSARFANWMHNGQGNGDTEDGVYDLAGTHPYYDPDGSINDYTALNAALMAVTRDQNATWVIPSEDEWYKSAYHKNDGDTGNYFDYPMSNNSAPSNALDGGGNNATFYDAGYTIGSPYWRTEVGAHVDSESPYDSFDQLGNVAEWNEAILYGSYRGMRGGAFNVSNFLEAADRVSAPTNLENEWIGFRLAQIPEPATLTLLALGGLLATRRRR